MWCGKWPSQWSSGQSSWLQIQGSGFDARRYQIFRVVGLKRRPLSLVSWIEELLEGKSSGSGLQILVYGSRDPLRRPRDTLYPQKLAVTSSASGCCSVFKTSCFKYRTGRWVMSRILFIDNIPHWYSCMWAFFLQMRGNNGLMMLSCN
jgi:hypothetical protein